MNSCRNYKRNSCGRIDIDRVVAITVIGLCFFRLVAGIVFGTAYRKVRFDLVRRFGDPVIVAIIVALAIAIAIVVDTVVAAAHKYPNQIHFDVFGL